jgi:hypothetical protein
MNEERFWALIEEGWHAAGGMQKERDQLLSGELSDDGADELMDVTGEMVEALRQKLAALDKDELLQFDRILEKKLYDIDRAKIQERTDGSDDGFLYARGFIVAAGKTYYDAVNAEPVTAMMNMESEDMCYVSWHVYRELFGDMPKSAISRESCSNKAGWPDLQSDELQ